MIRAADPTESWKRVNGDDFICKRNQLDRNDRFMLSTWLCFGLFLPDLYPNLAPSWSSPVILGVPSMSCWLVCQSVCLSPPHPPCNCSRLSHPRNTGGVPFGSDTCHMFHTCPSFSWLMQHSGHSPHVCIPCCLFLLSLLSRPVSHLCLSLHPFPCPCVYFSAVGQGHSFLFYHSHSPLSPRGLLWQRLQSCSLHV